MRKYSYLIVLTLILSLVLTGCLLSNVGQVPTIEQSGITYLTKSGSPPNLINLVGLWHLDEGSGITAFDSSGNTNDGTLMGDTIWTSGKFGDALIFDGDGDYVHLPDSNAILSTNTFTIEAWFKTSVNHPPYGGTEGRLVNLHWKSTASTAVSLYVEANKIGLLYHKGSMQHVWVKHTVNYYDNMWHHIAVTYDATIYRLYYDGVEIASRADAFGGFGTYPAYLGTYNGSERFFNGAIDEVRIWDIALAEDQLGSVIVAMDIKPQSCPNPLNVKNQGVLPVAILGTADFDVTEIDPASVKLEGAAPLRWALEDVATPFERSADCFNCSEEGPDGFLDLTLKFDTQEMLLQLSIGSDALVDVIPEDLTLVDGECITLTLTGYLYDRTPILGEDTVLIIKKGK